MRISRGAVAFLVCVAAFAQTRPAPVWKFAVSGDSRNCGDVVMPAIASGVLKSGASFYWHLGDFRAIFDFDEDLVPPAKLNLNNRHVTISDYLQRAWPDFIDKQIKPFGSLEVFLGIGNHETIYPKTRDEFVKQFAGYLDSPRLKAQKERDKDSAGPRTYYHWVMNDSVDFISMDNAAGNTFDAAQMEWVRARIAADEKTKAITTVVVGMHEALPGSKGLSHSMCDAPSGIERGREVYNLLWSLDRAGKKVYLLASHSHFVMDDVYNTPYWKGKVLPGWIVGTAGAVRYRLPGGEGGGKIAKTDVYGYLIGTVMSDGTVEFEFKELGLDDLKSANAGKLPDSLIGWCVNENRNPAPAVATACGAGN
ncbi:MAG TPA: hypothetical protein VG297_01625 [Bryobacteraceae bacterium]|jgi:hypothetical protein|nr:hypothetical protein [Bryobacteraceae bacterium]